MVTLPTRRSFLKSMAVGTCALPFLSGLSCDPTPQRPNIILIMGDDMGFSDIGCYGSEIDTPNLDKLAEHGLRFTQFYNTARCCPTRASLLTGLYPHQTGIGHMTEDNMLDGYRGDLNRTSMTIAEVLKTAGYSTYISGKWHVTPYIGLETPKHNWPLQRGFDRFFGTILGAGSFYDPCSLTQDNDFIAPDNDFYYTDAISEHAVRYIKEHDSPDPFFMYVSYTAAHWPMHARERDIAKYHGTYDKGWDELRRERHERMKNMGIVNPDWKLSARDEKSAPWVEEELKEWQARRMEVYAAMVDVMDQGIGTIVETLQDKGQFKNTLIFFLQDNGGCAERYGSWDKIKPSLDTNVPLHPVAPGALQTEMQPPVTRDGRPIRTGKGLMPGPADTYIAYGPGWANASNTPFRMYKHWVHEGGIATPLIVHWPTGIDAKGELRQQPGHLIDIMATCVDVSGAAYPADYNEHKITPMEGKSLVPAFDDNPIERDAIFWEHEGNRAIRAGKWKLVAKAQPLRKVTDRKPDDWELYDLETDRTETHNLADTYPDKVTEMAQRWEKWAIRAKVLPWPWDKWAE